MSRAFIKEDAASEDVIVPPRAPLPPGTPNTVTPRGMALLQAELAELKAQHAEVQASGDARELALAAGRLEALRERLASAKVAPPPDPASDEVAFGSSVTVRTLSGKFTGEERRFTIVGVDEAEGDETRVAFTAPIAQALLGHKVGEKVKLNVGRLEQLLEIVALRGGSEG